MRRQLQAYADRGVFRGFSELPARAGRLQFRFQYAMRRPVQLEYDAARGRLTFVDLLPQVPARSVLSRDIQQFVRGRTSPGLPAHRRIDARRVQVGCTSRHGRLSIYLVARTRNQTYVVNRAVNLLHEVLLYLRSSHPQYVWQAFEAPQE